MDNDLISGTDTSDMLSGTGAGDTQIAAATTTVEAPYDDARPLDAAKVEIPQGENVVREPVTPGEVVELPFPADSQFLARIDNGNLAIKVGDVTIILQGYVEAAGQAAPVIEASNGQPLDIATILASTDPNIDIQTAAGPAAGPQGQGADNTGAFLTQFGAGAGLGGFTGAGAQDGTDGIGGGTVDQTGTLFKLFGLAAITTNTAPVASDDAYTTNEDAKLDVPAGTGLLSNDPNGNTLTVLSVTQPANGAVVANPDGSFSYTPDKDYNGTDTFTYTADDGNGGTATATVTITVNPVNDAPVIGDAGATLNYTENAAPTVIDSSVTVSDIDSPNFNGGSLKVAFTANGAVEDQLTVIDQGSGPGQIGVSGSDITYGGVAIGTFTGGSNGSNLVITFNSDAATPDALKALIQDIAYSNSSDDPSSADRTVTFTLVDGDGTALGGSDTGSATATVHVIPVNDAPVVPEVTLHGYDEDTVDSVDLTGLVTVNDPDSSSPFVWHLDGAPPAGFSLAADGTLTMDLAGKYDYLKAGDTETVTLQYHVTDSGNADSNTSTIKVVIDGVNDAPATVADSIVVNEGGTATVLAGGATSVLTNDSDAESDPLSAILVSGPANGTLTLNPNGTFSYTHNGGETTTDSFTYKANDGTADGNTVTVNITVNPVDDAPVAVADSIVVNEGGAATVLVGGATSVLTNDTDAENNTLSAVLVSGPAHGSLTLNSDGTFSYIHDGSETTADSFTYKANDGTVDGNTVTVAIQVNPVNDAPVVPEVTLHGYDEDTVDSVDLTGLVTVNDPDSSSPFVWHLDGAPPAGFGLAADGTLTMDLAGKYDYLKAGDTETVTLQYHVTDSGNADSNTSTIKVVIDGVNDAPVTVADSIVVNEGGTATVLAGGATSVLTNDSDAESDPLSAILVSGPANGTLTLNPNGTFSYTHNGGETTTDSFTYKANDGTADGNTVTVNITVNPVDDAPVAVADSIVVNEGGAATVLVGGATSVLTNDTDAENNTLSAVLVSGPAHGSLTLNSDGTFSYIHDGSETTADSFTYKANDGTVDGNTVTVAIQVNPVNDAPVVPEVTLHGYDEDTVDSVDLTGLVTVNDPDSSSPFVWHLDGAPPAGFSLAADGTLTMNLAGKYDHLKAGDTETVTLQYHVTDSGNADSNTSTIKVVIDGVNDAPVAVDDIVITNVDVNGTVVIPEWALLANDTDVDSKNLDGDTYIGGSGFSSATHIGGVGDNGHYSFLEDATLGGSLQYKAQDGSLTSNIATVAINNQAGGDLAGTAAHEILISGGAGDKIDGHGGNDLIFGGDGDDTVFFHNGDVVQGGGDSIALSNALATPGARGDVLALDHDVNFTKVDLAHFSSVETISLLNADTGAAGAQSVTVGAATVTGISDHTITPGGLFAEHLAVKIDGDAVDQLYLSISKDGAGTGWADTGIDLNGYSVYAHEATAGNAATADAYVMVANTVPTANVHLNTDQP